MDVPVVIREYVLEEIKAELCRAQVSRNGEQLQPGRNLENEASNRMIEDPQNFAVRLSKVM